MPLPEGPAANTEQDLRAIADPLSIEIVDIALRALARTCSQTGQSLPAIRAARLTASQFEIYLTTSADLPRPWTATAGETVWTLQVDNVDDLDVDVADVPAPYPALVTVGHDDEDGHVLLNLEVLGAFGVTGADEQAITEVLAAIAVELATSAWADDLQVTIVGAFPDLEDALQTGRIRYLPSVGRILDDLLARATSDREAMTSAGVDDIHQARTVREALATWVPEIVLLAGEVTARQRNQLEQLVTDLPRVAMAVVTNGLKVGEWGLDLSGGTAPDHAIIAPIGLPIRPQRLEAAQYGHLLEIAALADPEELDPHEALPPVSFEDLGPVVPIEEREDVTANESLVGHATSQGATAKTSALEDPAPLTDDSDSAESEADVQSTPDVDDPDPVPQPRILVLGPVDLINPQGSVEPTKRSRLLEYAVYLSLYPGATHTAIDDAIWPYRRSEDNLNTRNTATSKLRRWIGTDPVTGQEFFPRMQAGEGYTFTGVTSDVDDWDRLIAHDPAAASTNHLEEALALVRGIPFEGTHLKRYAWAEPIKERLISEIVDASHELGRRRLMEGRWRRAEQAVVIGLRIEPAQESLWRLRILAAHESRDLPAQAEAIERLLIITQHLECDLEPETEALLDAIKLNGVTREDLHAL